MAFLRCKMCGGDLTIQPGSSVATCEFCGTQQTIPTVNDELLQGLFNRANVLRMKSEFDKAADLYEKILQTSPEQAEAYWGLILCKYGVEYVEDPKTLRRIPTCHRTSYDAITADQDYKNALRWADAVQRDIYESEAAAIDVIQKGILAISRQEAPYDVFLCYKETDASGKRTMDSVIANDIYHQLTQEGFKVFYATITLEDKLGTEYEPYIFSALNTAKVMLVLGTRPEHFNAVWVKNEWSRFLKLMKQDRSRLLIPCYRDMDAYELPEEFAHLQAQDMSKIGFINDIVRGIKKLVVKEAPAPAPAPQAAPAPAVPQAAPAANVAALLDRGNMALEDQQWDKASEYYDQVLNQDSRCGEAYLGMFLAENQGMTISEVADIRLEEYDYVKSKHNKVQIRDQKTVDRVVEDCVVPGFLEKKELVKLFVFNYSYDTIAQHWENALSEEQHWQNTDALLNRTRKFLTGEKKEALENSLESIQKTIREKLEAAREKDSTEREKAEKACAQAVEKAIALAKEMADNARREQESRYAKAEAAQEKAGEPFEYEKAGELFDALHGYRDSRQRAQQCRAKAGDIRFEREQREKKESKKALLIIGAIIAVVILAVIIANTVSNNKKYDAVRAPMIGQWLEGSCTDGRIKYDTYAYEYYVALKILDEKHCAVVRREEVYFKGDLHNMYLDVDPNATYRLSMKDGEVVFNWSSSKIKSSEKPFSIEIGTDEWSGEVEIDLYTRNFTGYESMRLDNDYMTDEEIASLEALIAEEDGSLNRGDTPAAAPDTAPATTP